MHKFCLGVLTGSLLSLFLPALPSVWTMALLIITIILMLLRQYFVLGLCCFLLSWHWHLQDYRLTQAQLLAEPAWLLTVQLSSVKAQQDAVLLNAKVLEGAAAGYYLKLRWRDAPQLQTGDIWRLNLRLQMPRSRYTPGGSSQRLQALLQQQLAEGYVDTVTPPMQFRRGGDLRQHLLQQLMHYWQDLPTAPLLVALTFGERDFSATLWQGLRHSGLGHILVISGLHISLVYGWSVLLISSLQRLGLPVKAKDAILLALLPAVSYAWLAGFAAPTLRATATLALLVLARTLLRPLAGWQYWLAICAGLLLLQPFWVLHLSFWLSAIAVALILLVLWWQGPVPAGFWLKIFYLLRFQFVLSFLMVGVSLVFFNGFTSLALLSNLIFVPWCTLLAIPVLIAVLCYSLLGLPGAELGWQLADWLFLPLLYWLDWSAGLSVWWSQPQLSRLHWVLLGTILLLLYFIRLPALRLLLIVLSCTLLVTVTKPANPFLVLLDAGQRTILLIRSHKHTLLYLDLPVTQTESVMQHQVLPLLRYYGVSQLSAVIWPGYQTEMHTGWQQLQDEVGSTVLYSAQPVSEQSLPCQQVLKYDALAVTHYPLPEADPCVLQLTLQGWRLLLPGLLRSGTELQLSQYYPELRTDLYLLAHYGRQDANSLHWLQHLAPAMVLLAAEHGGRLVYPVQPVRERLRLLNSHQLHSGEQGTIVLNFQPDALVFRSLKQQAWPRWLEKPVH